MLCRGGLEMLFSDIRRHALTLPATDKDGNPSTIAYLIHHLCEHVMKDTRRELFVLDGHLYVSPPLPHGHMCQSLVCVATPCPGHPTY